MSDINFNSLKDKAMDVDPDIRFMALEDFRKSLENDYALSTRGSLASQLEAFIPILLRMLEDQNPDVQNQAIKSFEPMVKYLTNDGLLTLIKRLYSMVQASNGKQNGSSNLKSFTTSIPNMALRSLFAQSNSRDTSDFVSDKLSASNYRFDVQLSRSIMNFLIPKIIETGKEASIDSIELLIDIIVEIGYVLTLRELHSLSVYLVHVSFTEAGIISKKSIVALEKVINLINDPHSIDLVLDEINDTESRSNSDNKLFVKFQLYSVCLNRGIAPSEEKITQIYNTIYSTIDIEKSIEEDQEDENELDFDLILQENLLKDEALGTLIDLTTKGFLPPANGNQVIDLLKAFLNYDPLNANDYDDFDDDDEDIVFSDDDQEGNDGEENDGSWKLRAKSAMLVRPLLQWFPESLEVLSKSILPILPIQDANDQVVIEAVKAAISIINATPIDKYTHIQAIVPLINASLDKLREDQFPIILKLIESLNRFRRIELVEKSFKCFQDRKIDTSSSIDYLQFFSSILNSFENIPCQILEQIVSVLSKNLEDKSFNMIAQSVECLTVLFNHNDAKEVPSELLQTVTDSLHSKVMNSKKYTNELMRLCIVALGQALSNGLSVSRKDILDTFKSSITLEGTCKTTIEVLNKTFAGISADEISPDYATFIIEKSSSLILSNNENISLGSLRIMNQCLQKYPALELDCGLILPNLIQSLKNSSKSLYKHIFQSCILLSSKIFQSEQLRVELLQTMVQLVNDGKVNVDDSTFYDLLRISCRFENGLFTYLERNLDINLLTSAKILAICVVESNNEAEVIKRKEEFFHYLANNVNSPLFAFPIRFLGYVGEAVPLEDITVDLLISLLKNPSLTNDANIEATATALALIARNDVQSNTPILLKAYTSSENATVRNGLLTSLGSVVDSCNALQSELIWKCIFNHPVEFKHSAIAELRRSGEILGKVINNSPTGAEKLLQACEGQTNLKAVYLILVVEKTLLNSLEGSYANDALLISLNQFAVGWLDIVNVDIRQIVVGNLLTGLHNKPSCILPNLKNLILPKLFQCLKAEEAFKKTIAMGPYKYVIDEGLEIRKLSYEFIYSLISLDEGTIQQYDINLEDIAENIIQQGLCDDQSDIIVLACINLVHFITHHQQSAASLLTRDNGSLFTTIIANLNTQLNKKLSVKASAQDTESHEERIKSIVKLSKKFNQVVETFYSENIELVNLVQAWKDYVSALKVKFLVYYNSTDMD
ncbi:TIP120 [[Candida] subhashii]|uniref:TIP120 n=1 Tax=[Candida] subhashii TaxID=561895 RepID=A0A8J5QHI2_9ASCO|nr:TIP120 [[Candida] subhashii]KAG7661252.1 TIP120 [[Candida] subhashii]